MSKARKILKKAAGNTSKRTTPRGGKKPCITRAEARRRAEQHVLKRILNQMFNGAKVRDGATARLLVYAPQGAWTNKDVWVVYKNSEGCAFQSSDVVLVCKRTGRVLYEGSANDEG